MTNHSPPATPHFDWEFGKAQRRPGIKGPRAVVSVAFSRQDFERVARCAEQRGKHTSQFIREAALAVASGQWRVERAGAFRRLAQWLVGQRREKQG